MAVLRYLVPALAVAGHAAAAQCSVSATTTIQSQADASALSGCSTFSGSIAVSSDTTDNIALDGIERITGDLVVNNNTQMTSLSGSTLATINGTFLLNGVTLLTSLNFPELSTVDAVDWNALPSLQGLSFTNGVEMADTISIQNTALYSLDGINLQRVTKLLVVNNNNLDQISMQLGYVANSLTLQANGLNVTAEFPNLQWAYNLTFQNVSDLSIPSLATVNESFLLISNEFTSLRGPNLTNVGATLSFDSNTDLTNVTMPKLSKVGGGLTVANNTEFDSISFPSLLSIGGALDVHGNFTDVALPKITLVSGAFNLQSTADISDVCSHFQPLKSGGQIRGSYTCAGEQSKPGGQGSKPTGAGANGGGGSASASSAAMPSYFPSSYTSGVLGVIAAIFGFL